MVNAMAELVRWRYKQLEANTANIGYLVDQLNDAAADGWELVELAYADKTIGLNSMFAIVRKALDHPADPDDLAAGWRDDPLEQSEHRYWNGHVWTVHVRGAKIEADLEADIEAIGDLGRNPTRQCRSGVHEVCKRKWCTCLCHAQRAG